MCILLHVVVKKFCEKNELNSMNNQSDFFTTWKTSKKVFMKCSSININAMARLQLKHCVLIYSVKHHWKWVNILFSDSAEFVWNKTKLLGKVGKHLKETSNALKMENKSIPSLQGRTKDSEEGPGLQLKSTEKDECFDILINKVSKYTPQNTLPNKVEGYGQAKR